MPWLCGQTAMFRHASLIWATLVSTSPGNDATESITTSSSSPCFPSFLHILSPYSLLGISLTLALAVSVLRNAQCLPFYTDPSSYFASSFC